MPETRQMLDIAARLAMRGAGDVEPNPMVGAVLVRDGRVVGLGHHRRFGGLHAEREALADCRRRGEDPRGATAYVTLEPCCHHGKQPPCTQALIEAAVGRVVYARRDPHLASRGGAEVLERSGIPCDLDSSSVLATRLSDPFVKRVKTGLPWVIAKWAQTADGRMTTPNGESPWISNALSLRRVHRLRARVDAILTGIGTVLADDPLLTARGVPRVRRVAQRIVLDGNGVLPADCRLRRTAGEAPLVVVQTNAQDLGDGIEVVEAPERDGRVDLAATFPLLAERFGLATVMLECGPTLLGACFDTGLVDEAFVYIAPAAKSEAWPPGPSDAPDERSLARFELVRERPLEGDTERWYRKPVA